MPIGETGPRKIAPIIPSLRGMQHGRTYSASGVPLSFQKSPKRVTLTESGQLLCVSPAPKLSVPTMGLSKARSDGNVVGRSRKNKQDPINDSFNKLNE